MSTKPKKLKEYPSLFASDAARRFILLVSALVMTVGIQSAFPQQPSSTARDYADLFVSDLVVRGRVATVNTEVVPAGEYDPKWKGREGYFRILSVELTVDEVLRGYWSETSVTLYVNQNQSDLGGKWSVGDEAVVPLRYVPSFRGGVLALSSEAGRFVRHGSTWRSAGLQKDLELDELRTIMAPAHLDQVTAASGRVVVGTVSHVEQRRIRDPSESSSSSGVWIITMRPDQVVKGPREANPLTFKVFTGGSYWPSWAALGPAEVEVGNTYCVFLSGPEGDLHVTQGGNGIFEVGGDGRLQHNSFTMPVKVANVKKLVAGQ